MADCCTICTCESSALHMHHTVPRSRGGENSLQIPLCGDCHTTLHANAVYLVSKLNNPKRESKTFWVDHATQERAQRWLEILVRALVSASPEQAAITEYPVGTKLKQQEFIAFKQLAKDLGCSQEKAVEYCIKYVLKIKGFGNETKPQLWFLPPSGS